MVLEYDSGQNPIKAYRACSDGSQAAIGPLRSEGIGAHHYDSEIAVDVTGELRDLQRLIAAGKLASARGKYRSIADRMHRSAEEEEQLLLEFFKAQILAGEDDYATAIDIADRLLPRFTELNLRNEVARCHLMLSGLLLRTGDYDRAKAHAEAAVYFSTWEIEDDALKGDAHNNLGLALKNLGVWEEAERHLREAAEAYACIQDGVRDLRASLNLGILLRKMGKIAEATDICKDGIRKSEDLGVPIGACRYALELANIAVIERDVDEGREYLDLARHAIDTYGYQREGILAIQVEGDLFCLEGETRRALDAYGAGLKLARDIARDGDLEAEILRRAAAVCLEMGEIRDGRHFVDEALSLTEKGHDAYEHGICLRILGRLEIEQGMGGSGIAHLQEAARELSGLSPWCHELARTELALGKVLLEQTRYGAAGSAVGHLLGARRIYSNLGVSSAVRDLDELVFSTLAANPAAKHEPLEPGVRVTSRRHIDAGQYGIVTEDERILGDLERWGPTEARILIEGETGVGKELLARGLHAMSRRREGPFVAVDCGALSETLADSELFGHARGAFTGAMKDRIGLIEAANGGTLMLDEIGELSEILQVKLLRVLEDGIVRRVGENTSRRIDVRVISATARDLWAEVEAGRFRRDLYYRLKTVLIRVPSLRERPYDIDLLLDYYVQVYADRHGASVSLSREATHELARHAWPGNVRELKNVVEALILSSRDGEVVEANQVRRFLTDRTTEAGLRDRIADLEHEEIERVLKLCAGNKTKAAKMLGISRKTLWQKLKQMNSS
jgi:DNA-binding NtrC family response regulator/tetratricopeptide (TPR) repeat protein